MENMIIKFDTIAQIKEFIDAIQPFSADFDLVHNRYIIDAKSIMGIFSMDLSKPLTLVVHSDSDVVKNQVKAELKRLNLLCN